MKPVKISWPNSNHKVFISKESNTPTLWNIGILHYKQAKLPIHLQHSVIKFQFFTNLIIWLGMTAFVFYDQIFIFLAKLKVFLFPCGLLFSSTLDANHGRNGYTILATWTPNSLFGFFIVLQALFAITVEVVLFLKCRFSHFSEVWKVIF